MLGGAIGIFNFPFLIFKLFRRQEAVNPKQKREAYERQKGICVKCKKRFDIEEMEADHIRPWHEGGKTTEENCQLLCKDDNRRKSGR
jgi:5-methylcytosine-specific restriction endonuclease McrA